MGSVLSAKHGGKGGNERSEQNGTRRQRDHIRAGCFDLVEKRPDITRRAASERDHQEDIASHKAHDVGTSRANRHADTDLAAALEDRVVEDSVEPDVGEQPRDSGKEGQRAWRAVARERSGRGTNGTTSFSRK